MEVRNIQERLGSCAFRLQSNPLNKKGWEWGTGFFVSPRIALTAWHNIPKRLIDGESGEVRGLYVDADEREHELRFRWERDASSSCHDIAVLRLTSEVKKIAYLKAAMLPVDLSTKEMSRYWFGRVAVIYGFPFSRIGNGTRLLIGQFHAGQPVEELPCTDPETGETLRDPATGRHNWTVRLRVHAENAYELAGISGGPIVDVETGCVVGVEHSYKKHQRGDDPSYHMVYGTPLCRMASLWNDKLAAELGIAVLDSSSDAKPKKQNPAAYLKELFEKTGRIDIRGLEVGSGRAYRFGIDKIYVPLRTASPDPRKGLALVPLHHLLDRPGLVILGDPGSGKTTFVRWVVHALAETLLANEEIDKPTEFNPNAARERLGLETALFPVYIRLADLSDFIVKMRGKSDAPWAPDSPEWLFHYLHQLSKDSNWGLDASFFRQQMTERSPLLLMDGLDEAANTRDRENLGVLVKNIQRAYPACKVVITTRPGHEDREQVIDNLDHARIEPLDDEGVQAFLKFWCDALYLDNKTESFRHFRELALAISSNLPVRRMARNPVMLTAVALLYWNERRLPDRRVEVYGSVIKWLALSRQERPERPGPKQCIEYLQELALAMQMDADGRKTQVSLRRAAEWLAGRFGNDVDRAEAFLRDEQMDSGIIIARGNTLRFWHLTFQEFLAARAIARKLEADRREIFSVTDRLYSPDWHEVVLLHVGLLHEDGGADQVNLFFREVLDRVYRNKRGVRRLLPFGRAPLAERAKCAGLLGAVLRDLQSSDYSPKDERFEELRKRVLGIYDKNGAQSVPLFDRIQVADTMPKAGNPMLDRWAPVPAGEFWMGAQHTDPSGRNYDRDAMDNESPVYKAIVDAFDIGRYPVTVGEFRDFVQENGYKRAEWWSPEAYGKFAEPDRWELQLQYPNRPVVGVSWYEAAAYCAFAACRLPTEAEWEWAARRDETRKYPWGKEKPEPSRLNYELSLRQLTPVGIYPAGATPDGIFDMAGGVWEWCSDWYGPYTTSPEPNPAGPAAGSNRVLRGGSWNDSFIRAATRNRYPPETRRNNIGFRLISA
jgi:formylglycine-generating enzyme required for sulfatase activity